MARKLSLRDCLLLLLMAISMVGSTIYFRDFDVTAIILSLTLSDLLYQKLDKMHQFKLLVPCGFAFALALGGMYYIADLLVFPHSARASHRLQDACVHGLLLAAFGLLAAHWSPDEKRTLSPTLSQ